VKECLAGKVLITDFVCNASLSRWQNTLQAARHAGAINHITGDVNFLALGLRGKRNILTIHDLGHYDTLKKRNALQFLVYKLFWFRLPLRYVSMVTVVSEFTKSKLIGYFNFPEDRIRIIPDPVKPIFQYVPKVELNAKPHILMMGTGKHKNLDNLVEAAKDSDFHIDIIGWPAPDELEKLRACNIAHKVYSHLTDEEVYQRYIACDIMFNASFYEGFGMPIIEAQAVGRPVITSNLGAMAEVARDSAVLVDPGQPAAIRDAIRSLVEDREYYNKIVALGRENAARFDYKSIALQYLEIYREMAGSNK